jgi:hypothetical protein
MLVMKRKDRTDDRGEMGDDRREKEDEGNKKDFRLTFP